MREPIHYDREPQPNLRRAAWRAVPVATVCLLAIPLLRYGEEAWLTARVQRVERKLAAMTDVRVLDRFVDDRRELRPFVSFLHLELSGRPGETIALQDVEAALSDRGHARLSRIGRWSFEVRAVPGRSARQPSHGPGPTDRYSIDIGTRGDFAHLVPFPVRGLRDVVERYEDILKVIETWPRSPDFAQTTTPGGRVVTYSVTEAKE